jgi:hypothetical protein
LIPGAFQLLDPDFVNTHGFFLGEWGAGKQKCGQRCERETFHGMCLILLEVDVFGQNGIESNRRYQERAARRRRDLPLVH